ncbi:hypothetical protein DYU05_04070 [Mucilaginibacter terrenus]|uniref:Uncharacterized protein n=1 Tax=Mucilaginibacter terrenus TaxID=2482727 RepID=A0A3E2NUW5_9SPHI|nr:hypothetical protein [Mucilaginibacter terrenus]RFZ84792.1 hypothetical protein DYU05_04070 [Mucilaginibacter terrenus]
MNANIAAAVAEYHVLKDQLAVLSQGLADHYVTDDDIEVVPVEEIELKRALLRMYLIEDSMKKLEKTIAHDLQFVSLTNF